MAKTGGFFLQGLGSGLQTGFQMGQQIREMKWKKDERDKLEKAQEKIMEGVTTFNNKIKEFYADGTISDDENMQLTTMYLSSAYDVKDKIEGTYKAIQQGQKDIVDQNFQWLDLYGNWVEGLDPSNIPELFDYVKGNIKGKKAQEMFTAYDNVLKKKAEALRGQQPEVFTSPSGVQSAYPEAGWEYSSAAKGYVPTFQKPTEVKVAGISDYNSAATYLSKFVNSPLDVFNKEKTSIQNKFGIDVSNITQESLREPVGGGTEKPRVTSLPQLEEYRTKALEADTWEDAQSIINDYTQAGYDVTQLGVTQKDWANNQTTYLEKIKTSLDNITNEKGWLKTGTLTADIVGVDFKGEQKVEEIYKQLYEQYMQYRNMLEKMGIDVSQFPKLKPLNEIEKVGFIEGLKTFGGVGKGQYKSIYY